MKIRPIVVVAVATSVVALAGCDRAKALLGGGGQPKGQVVATVNGEEITALELRAELGGFSSRDPAVVKAAQQTALQRIIMRRLMADAAKEQKLDKSPDFTVQKQRTEEAILAELYQRKLAGSAGQPTREEAEAYVASHPEQFAQRQLLVVDQLMAAPNQIPPEKIQPLKTLDEVKALLDAEAVPYQTSAAMIDTAQANPRFIQQIKALPPGEVFVLPQAGGLLFNQINGTKSAPVQGEAATNYALQLLREQRARETVGKKLSDMRNAADKSIVYNPAYKPPAPPKPGAAPAAKPAAPAAAQP